VEKREGEMKGRERTRKKNQVRRKWNKMEGGMEGGSGGILLQKFLASFLRCACSSLSYYHLP
jgi:hypothetical protein